MKFSRRMFLGAAGAAWASAAPALSSVSAEPRTVRLTARKGAVRLAPEGAGGETPVWCYDGRVPGPLIRARRGETLNVELINRLDEPTSIHWHGLRGANAMDGVPYLTQAPVPPGGAFTYKLETPDAGTFWYHPHIAGSRQLGRGLYGAVIVDAPEPAAADRSVLWVLDDWRLDKNGAVHESFGAAHDASHAGRLGNTAVINGSPRDVFGAVSGERIRLRLLNAANARVFRLKFEDHNPWVIARDGHPAGPYRLPAGGVTLAPGQRADLIIDMTGAPGGEYAVSDSYYPRQTYRLAAFKYAAGPARAPWPEPPRAEAANPVPEPDLRNALPLDMTLEGGAMRGFQTAELNGEEVSFRGAAARGYFWAVNGAVRPPLSPGGPKIPLAEIPLGRTVKARIVNRTAWDHPVHLHGFAFRVLSRSDRAPESGLFDTVLTGPGQEAEIAFVCDRPGDWAFHCHILEHQESGMAGFLRVA